MICLFGFSESTCSGVSKISYGFLYSHSWVNKSLSMMWGGLEEIITIGADDLGRDSPVAIAISPILFMDAWFFLDYFPFQQDTVVRDWT
jgi:hypothetical protein